MTRAYNTGNYIQYLVITYNGKESEIYIYIYIQYEIFLLLLFSYSVVSNSLQPHGLQHARLLCPSPSPRVCSNSYPLTQWCHPTISSSATPFSSCPQSFPESFSLSRLFASDSQSIGVAASASIFPVNIQGWFPLGWTGLISLKSKGLSRVFSSTTIWNHQFFGTQPYL